MSIQGDSMPHLGAGDLDTVAGARVFFGHQSVGQNVLDGVRAVYPASGRSAPAVRDAYLGENEKPLLKIEDFDARMRAGMGREVDVAMMKLCYIDITTQTDVDGLFGAYRTTLAALERDFPDVTFVHVTVPLTTERGRLAAVRAGLTRSERYGPGENVNRERLNSRLRDEYAGRHLFDLAAAESTAPDGTRVTGRHRGSDYYALYDGFASDSGHLNPTGAQVAATAWLATVAHAVRDAEARRR